MRGIEAGGLHLGLCGQPLDCGDAWWASDYGYMCACYFSSGLCFVAAVSKQACGSARDGEGCARSGEAGEITDIWKVGDKQAGEAGFGETAAE